MTYANQYTKPFNEVTGVIPQLQSALAGASRVFEVLDEDNQTPDSANSVEMSHCKGAIDIENVCFSYSPERRLIEGFNLKVKPGQRVAIVGPTGCGKTTLINLLMRFYEINSGKILIDGVDTQNITWFESFKASCKALNRGTHNLLTVAVILALLYTKRAVKVFLGLIYKLLSMR